jgi:hypothetical protein
MSRSALRSDFPTRSAGGTFNRRDVYSSNRIIEATATLRLFDRKSYDIVGNRRAQAALCAPMASYCAGKTAPQPMPNKAYLVRFKGADLPPQLVIAETIEFHGEHLVFLRSDGSLAALIVLEIVESWAEVKP